MSVSHSNIRLPPDDHMLEAEEVEGLVRTNGTNGRARKSRTKRAKKSSIVTWAVKACRANKVTMCVAFLVVGLLVVVLFGLDAKEVGENSSSKVVDKDCEIPKDAINAIVNHTIHTMNQNAQGQEQQQGDQPEEADKVVSAPNDEATKQEQETASEEKPAETPAETPAEPEAKPTDEEKPAETPAQEPATPQETPVETPVAPEVQEEKPTEEEFFKQYPHRDVPNDKFPSGAWQADPTKVQEYLARATTVVDAAIGAILQEYGKALTPDNKVDDMFALDFRDFDAGDGPLAGSNSRGGPPDNGGWTTRRSFDGLVRRILHAMITQDTFTLVLGGHSAAAGHGNHFQQSYAMQFHVVMEPVFRKLGMSLTSRNLAQGGLGTIQSAMGAGDIYGKEMDIILWDSGMTEGRAAAHIDLFMRQAILGGNRVPVLWGGDPNIFKLLHQSASVDIGQYGTGMKGIPATTDENQATTIPFAARFMKCSGERGDLCTTNKFRANCWIERPDVTPPTPQQPKPGAQVGWHPGFRFHQLQGRVLAMTVLQALKEALEKWKQVGDGKLLPENEWHVTDYYENIRSKTRTFGEGPCYEIKGTLPVRMCNTPMKGRTQFTPRANPEETSMLPLLKPDADGRVPHQQEPLLYEGPDVYNPLLHVPEGEFDVVAVINGTRRQRQLQSSLSSSNKTYAATSSTKRDGAKDSFRRGFLRRSLEEQIVVGKGWELAGEPNGRCGGEYDDICGRSKGDPCLLNAHHDQRGGLLGNCLSGWLVMDLPEVKEGIIVLKFETWHFEPESTVTVGWTSVNNEGGANEQGRELKPQPPAWPETFMFDVAINGKIKSYNKAEFENERKMVQRVVETITILDDENFIQPKGQEQTVQLAFRMRGCERAPVFKLTHVYWA